MTSSFRLAFVFALGIGAGVLIGAAEMTPPDGRPDAALDVHPPTTPPWALHRAWVLPAQETAAMQTMRGAGRLSAVDAAGDRRAD